MRKTVITARTCVALLVAVALHALLLSMPVTQPGPPASPTTLVLDLTTRAPAAEAPPADPEPMPEPVTPATMTEKLAKNRPTQPAPVPVEPERPQPPAPIERVANKDLILARQYITEEPVIDRIFGRPIERPASPQVDFRIPQRTDMLTILDKPMQDLPFDYTPGLVRFAYDPGVMGDLQRFWDVITPEFGWRTNNGTEVRCIVLLVVLGCGWK